MCIAIYKPKDKTISKESLQQCFKSNPDGAGFLVAMNKKLILSKGFFTFDSFYEAYEKYGNEQCLIHFRIKTHGDINVENCHPFMINSGLGFIHNGIITGFGVNTVSDTRHFNEAIFKPLVAKYGNQVIFEPAIQDLVEARIGYSKLAFLDRHGNYKLFNEEKGVWDNDVWYSNSSYKPVTYLPYKTTTSVYPTYRTNTMTAKPKHRTVVVGDIVQLIAGFYDSSSKTYQRAGSIHEVVAVNKDYTVDLMSEDQDKDGNFDFSYNVSYTKFDFLEVNGDDLIDDDNGYTNNRAAILI